MFRKSTSKLDNKAGAPPLPPPPPSRPESIDEMRRRIDMENKINNTAATITTTTNGASDTAGPMNGQRPRAQSVEEFPLSSSRSYHGTPRLGRWGKKSKKKQKAENQMHYLDQVPDGYVSTDAEDDISRASSRVSALSGLSIFNRPILNNNASNKRGRGVASDPSSQFLDGNPSFHDEGLMTGVEDYATASQRHLYDSNHTNDPSASDASNGGAGGGGSSHFKAIHRASLAAVSDIEKLAQKKGTNPLNEKFKVLPDEAYPSTYFTREELRAEMNKKSAYFHDLRLTTKRGQELGQVRLEILQCFGIPTTSLVRETCAYAIAVCGSYAFKTDTMPPVANPMWLKKMRRACLLPIFHAYARLYIGVFDHGTVEGGSASDFAGRIVLDVARFRPGCTYDITLPLRQSAHVFSREHRGSIRVRLHLVWNNERDAILSYLPSLRNRKRYKPTSPTTPAEACVTINCLDERSFRNVAQVVHGRDMPGKFSMTLLKATIRELNFTRIHLLRYLYQKQLYQLRNWEYPVISGFVFVAWMHCIYTDSVRYIPGHIITFFLLHLWKNYAFYIVLPRELKEGYAEKGHVGFLPPTVEELFAALLRGTKKRKFIAPLDMETDDVHPTKNPLEHMEPKHDEIVSLPEIAEAMRNSVSTRNHTHKWKTYKNCFTGTEAVDFLVSYGYAMCREEAVQLGKTLARETKLFEHVTRSHDFEDKGYYYQFLDYDTKRYIITGHIPAGKHLFQALGWFRKPTLKNMSPSDDVESQGPLSETTTTQSKWLKKQKKQDLPPPPPPSQDLLKGPKDTIQLHHVEFPFASGEDHPRFTVKESLVIRSAEARKILKQQKLEEDVADCAQFGVAPVFHGQGEKGGKVGKGSKGPVEKEENIRRSMQSSKVKLSVAHTGTMNVADPEEIYNVLSGAQNPTLDELIQEHRNANAITEHEYDSDDDVEDVKAEENKRRGVVIEEKILKKPPNQDLSRRGGGGGGDKAFAKVLQNSRHRLHAMLGHMFNDHVFKVDDKIFPTTIMEESDVKTPKRFKRKSVFGLIPALNSDKAKEEEKKKKLNRMTPFDAKADEYERLLQLNKYSHANPFMNRVAVLVQPLVEMVQALLAVSRALFNIFTWQDPYLTFWFVFFGPILVLILHFAPWRIIFGVTGIVWIGPQNWLMRLLRERSPNYKPKDFDKIVKRKRIKPEPKPEEITYFSEEAPGNRLLFFKNIDPSKVKQIVVPYGQLKYQRFYDWPPEPEYAKVSAGPPPKNDRAKTEDEESEYGSDNSNNSYWFDPTASLTRNKKKKKGMKKVAAQARKGARRGAGAVVGAGGAMVGGTSKVVTKATKATVKGTATLTTGAVKGATRWIGAQQKE